MTRLIARRNGPRRTRSIPTPRIGHFYLNVSDQRLFCLDETARQFVREGVPILSADLLRQPLLHLDGSSVGTDELPLERTRRNGQAHEDTFLLCRDATGQELLSWSAAPLCGAAGQVVGVAATAVVTTVEPDWEELAGLSHDIRTPLQTLRLLVPVLESLVEEQAAAEIGQRMSSAAEQAQAIAREILEWCRAPVQGTRRPHFDWMNLERLLREQGASQIPAAQGKGIGLEMDLAAVQGVEMHTDRVRLARIFGNLLTNAVRYTDRGGVRLKANWRAVHVGMEPVLVLTVEDTGAGLTQGDHDSIFQPYQRSSTELSDTDPGGTGLGLATVDRLVSELGLTLEVFTATGQGTRFEVIVPAAMVRSGT